MSYRLNKVESQAIAWYALKHNLRLSLSLMPVVYFIDLKDKIVTAHIDIIVEFYNETGKV